MAYTKKFIENGIEEVMLGVDGLYRKKSVNYKGKTADGEYYTEIIAAQILQELHRLDKIAKISRRSSYKVEGHTCLSMNNSSNRLEERIAMEMRKQLTISGLGEILDYQVPLKDKQIDDAGKIDVLSFDKSNGVMRILELKRPGSEETLLRCVLEAYTYSKQVDQDKLLKDFKEDLGGVECTCIKPCPCFFPDSEQFREYEELMNGFRPNLKELMEKLGIELIVLEGNYPRIAANILKY